MVVWLWIGHVLCQGMQFFTGIRIDVLEGICPALIIVKRLDVPCIIGHRKQCDLGSLCFLHRIGDDAFQILWIDIRM